MTPPDKLAKRPTHSRDLGGFLVQRFDVLEG